MSVELPKDAEGREIPLDTVALFSSDGNVLNIVRWIYTTDFDLRDDLANGWSAIDDIGAPINPELMYLTQPDSWEKLEEDLNRCIRADSLCPYNSTEECSACVLPMETQNHCNSRALKDIVKRIRKLRSEDE